MRKARSGDLGRIVARGLPHGKRSTAEGNQDGLRPGSPFTRPEVLRFLEGKKIATRSLFGGNLVRQPAYAAVPHRVVGTLEGADFAMERVFWIGVYPGLSGAMLEYMVDALHEMCRQTVMHG